MRYNETPYPKMVFDKRSFNGTEGRKILPQMGVFDGQKTVFAYWSTTHLNLGGGPTGRQSVAGVLSESF